MEKSFYTNEIRGVGENNMKASNTNCRKEYGEREFIYCLWHNKLVQLPRLAPGKPENEYSTLIKLLGIFFRPREIIVPLAKG